MGRAARQFYKKVKFSLETGVGYVTSNCIGHAVLHFEKEVSFTLGERVENNTSSCMGRTARQVQ